METRQQKLLRQALAQEADKAASLVREAPPPADQIVERPEEASLRELALQRAQSDYVPRTLTPYEWELYYQEHGVPEAHRRPASAGDDVEKIKDPGDIPKAQDATAKSWWSVLVSRFFY